ncbi:MAG: GyrI-like domain-containing protein [Hyphomicrobium sp.]
MKSGLVYLRPWRLAYVRQVGPYEETIPAAWDMMLGWLEKNGLHTPISRGFGLMRDSAKVVGVDKCRYDACVDLDPLFEERAMRELGVQTLPGGSYLRSRNVGSHDDLHMTLHGIHDAFEAPSGLNIDERRPLVTIYLDDPRQMGQGDVRADVCVPVNVRTHRIDAAGQQAA